MVRVFLLLAASLLPAADLVSGHRSYQLLCQTCHGEDGDALNYPNIVPLSGIHRRYPPQVIAKLSGSFSGRLLHGKDLDDIVAYMGTLRGAKSLPDPGWIASPHLLEMKSPRLGEFRVLDLRPIDDYRQGHVANAVHVDTGPCLTSPESTAAWLGQLGISPTTAVVIYGETGSETASCLWWRIRRAGHAYVSVLDGGWERWRRENRFTTQAIPAIAPTIYPAGASLPPGPCNPDMWDGTQQRMAHRILHDHLQGRCTSPP